MSKDVRQENSKEFQLKVLPVPGSGGSSDPGDVDRALFERVKTALRQAATAMTEWDAPALSFPAEPWVRNALRFDSAPPAEEGFFRRQGLSLAIEATDERTKLKCKRHGFIPALIFDKAKDSVCYPRPGPAGRYKHCDPKLKVEQDIHFNNTKTCVSGSLFLEGRQEAVSNLGYFSAYFKGLEKLAPANTPLVQVSHWRETVFDDIELAWGDTILESLMLVNRWSPETNALVESELAFKVVKEAGKKWDMDLMQRASLFYAALGDTGAFRADPPIFYYRDPVASVDVARV